MRSARERISGAPLLTVSFFDSVVANRETHIVTTCLECGSLKRNLARDSEEKKWYSNVLDEVIDAQESPVTGEHSSSKSSASSL